MKIQPVHLLIALVIGALVSYGIMQLAGDNYALTLGIGSFVTLAATLGLTLGVSFERSRVGANVRLVSLLFFTLLLLSNAGFALTSLSKTAYIIATGIIFMLFVLIANAVASAEQ